MKTLMRAMAVGAMALTLAASCGSQLHHGLHCKYGIAHGSNGPQCSMPQPGVPSSNGDRQRAVVTSAVMPTWIVSSHAVSLLEASGASRVLITTAFGRSFVPGRPGTLGVPTVTFTSYANAKTAFASGAVPAAYKALLYDPEDWKYTPQAEQAHPAYYMRLACHLAHVHGLICITTPAIDLAGTSRAYLADRLAAKAARYADVIDVQAQRYETRPLVYRAFVNAAVKQAKNANPRIRIMAGLSTSNASYAWQLWHAYEAVRLVTQGYWLNIPGKSAYCPNCPPANPGIALRFLDRIY